MINTGGIATSTIEFSPIEILLMILVPLVVAASLIWYRKQAEGNGWISQKQLMPGKKIYKDSLWLTVRCAAVSVTPGLQIAVTGRGIP